MFAEVIAVGSELTCGAKLDTNSQWLSRELESLGWTVTRHTSLSDNLTEMIAEFQAAAQRSQAVIITGGLGPTLDDITRDALADAFGQTLVLDPDSLQQIQNLFAARGRDMPERNQRQALRPEFAESLQNHCGTAPGILMKIAAGTGCLIAALPGVPAEMKPMFELQVRPRLPGSGMSIYRTLIRSFGYGESDAERLLGDLTARGRNPEVGITASEAVISLSITAKAVSPEECRIMAESVRLTILQRLGSAVYCEGDLELHEVVAKLLLSSSQKVSLIEGSTTGGLMGCWLTEDPEISGCLASGQISPDRQPVPVDAQSIAEWEHSAQQQAQDLLQTGIADFVLLTSPHQSTTNSSGVTLKQGRVAMASANTFQSFDVSMSGNLAIFRQRAARTALNQLRLQLIARLSATGTESVLADEVR